MDIIRLINYLETVATVSVATGYGETVYGKGAGARGYGRDDALLDCGRRGKKNNETSSNVHNINEYGMVQKADK